MSNPSPKAIIDHLLKNDRFSAWLGIELVEFELGSCTIAMTIRDEMLNGFKIAHGGVTFAFADSALAIASNGYNKISLALETSMSFTAMAKPGDRLTARAKEVNKSNRIAVYSIEIVNQDEVTIGLFKGTVYRTNRNLIDHD